MTKAGRVMSRTILTIIILLLPDKRSNTKFVGLSRGVTHRRQWLILALNKKDEHISTSAMHHYCRCISTTPTHQYPTTVSVPQHNISIWQHIRYLEENQFLSRTTELQQHTTVPSATPWKFISTSATHQHLLDTSVPQ